MYRICAIDPDDEDACDTIKELDALCGLAAYSKIEPSEKGDWWLVYKNDEPVAYAGMTQSTFAHDYGYLKRAGVLPNHRGKGLQRRLIKVRERKAKQYNWRALITDTTANPASSNSLIRCGYFLFEPEYKWAYKDSLYWRKVFR